MSRDWYEWQRKQALRLKHAGWKQRDIARALDVTEWSVSTRLRRAREAGPAGLDSHPRPGAPGTG